MIHSFYYLHEMPNYVWLDSSAKQDNPTVIIGKTILLKIIENEQNKSLLKEPLVKKFVTIKNLPKDQTRTLVNEILQTESFLLAPKFIQVLMKNKDKLKQLTNAAKIFENIFIPLKDTKLFQNMQLDIAREQKKAEMIVKNEDVIRDFMFKVVGKFNDSTVKKFEEKIVSLNKTLEKTSGVSIIIPSTLFLCPTCNVLLGANDIVSTHCFMCKSEISTEEMKRIPIFGVPESIKTVWKSNLWFEAYVAGILRKLGFKTWTGIHVMGASGILHEVDVLGIKDGSLVVCECKTGNISRQNVFNFITKSNDLKVHVSILALVRQLPEPHTKQFVKRNPAIVLLENMGNLEESDLIADLKNRLSFNT